ncbi:hypothetical protein G6F63_013791 [Rhizopus arrhizus]|nr:hypothetical protein G6F63_013791 [Rhizopus arrhizus]
MPGGTFDLGQVGAIYQDPAGLGLDRLQCELEQRRLPCPGLTHQEVDAAAPGVEGRIMDAAAIAVVMADMLELDPAAFSVESADVLGLPFFGCRPQRRQRRQQGPGTGDVIDRARGHLKGHVELQQEQVEQHDIADAQGAALVAREQQCEGDDELDRQADAQQRDEADPLQHVSAPAVADLLGLLLEALDHPSAAAELPQRLHCVPRIA